MSLQAHPDALHLAWVKDFDVAVALGVAHADDHDSYEVAVRQEALRRIEDLQQAGLLKVNAAMGSSDVQPTYAGCVRIEQARPLVAYPRVLEPLQLTLGSEPRFAGALRQLEKADEEARRLPYADAENAIKDAWSAVEAAIEVMTGHKRERGSAREVPGARSAGDAEGGGHSRESVPPSQRRRRHRPRRAAGASRQSSRGDAGGADRRGPHHLPDRKARGASDGEVDSMTRNVALIYVRVSRVDEEERARKVSPAMELEKSLALRELQGMTIEEPFQDLDISGKNTVNRPGYLAMLKRLERGDVAYVVAYDQSRVTRNVGDLQRFREALVRHGALFLESSTGRLLDPDDEDQELGSNVIGSVDQHYRRKLARRVRDALATKAARGELVGPVPAGYVRRREILPNGRSRGPGSR
jgi:DNA invertase Pin-like site-specific DNA recombinase